MTCDSRDGVLVTAISIAATGAATILIATTAAAATVWALLALACLIDNDGAIAKRRTVQTIDGAAGFLIVAHLNETEAFAAPGVTIHNNCRRDDFTNLPEEINKVLIRRLVRQATNINSHSGLLPHRRLLFILQSVETIPTKSNQQHLDVIHLL